METVDDNAAGVKRRNTVINGWYRSIVVCAFGRSEAKNTKLPVWNIYLRPTDHGSNYVWFMRLWQCIALQAHRTD